MVLTFTRQLCLQLQLRDEEEQRGIGWNTKRRKRHAGVARQMPGRIATGATGLRSPLFHKPYKVEDMGLSRTRHRPEAGRLAR